MPFRLLFLLLGCQIALGGCQSASRSPAVFIDAKQYQGEGLYVFFVPDMMQKSSDPPPKDSRYLYMHLVNGTGQTLLIEDVAGWDTPSIYVSAEPADGREGHGYVAPVLRVGQLQFQEYSPLQRSEVERMIKMRWLMYENEIEHRTYQYRSKAIPIEVPDWSIPMIVTVDDSLRTYTTDPPAHVFLPIKADILVEPKRSGEGPE